MVLLHIIDELKVGGAQTQLADILREAIRRYPIKHHVVSLFGDGPIGQDLRSLGVPVEALDLRPQLGGRRFLAAAKIIEERIRFLGPAVVEAHLTWSRLLGLHAAWRAGVPLRIAFEQGDIYLNSWKFRAANFIGQYLAHHIVVCSRALGEWDHRTHGFSWQRMTILHSCVDVDCFRPGRYTLTREEFGFPAGSTVFCAAGMLGNGVNKRVDICIRGVAAARSRGANVDLAICGDGAQRHDLEALATGLGLGRHVRFLGMRPDLPAVFGASDAFCHAAPFEPFGCVCVDAMATGLPVLVPDSGGIREAVDDGVTGLIYPALNYEALATAMCKLHSQPDLRRTMGAAARQSAEQRFSVERYVQRLYGIYGIKPELPGSSQE